MPAHHYSDEIRLIRDLKRQVRRIRQKLQTHGAWENQPRAPAGQEDGGQCTSSGAGSASDKYAGRLTLSSIGWAAFCEAQYQRDLNECRRVRISGCYAQAMQRKVACEKGRPIPPLFY